MGWSRSTAFVWIHGVIRSHIVSCPWKQAKRKKADDRHQEAKNLEMEAGSLYEHATAPENEMLGLDDPALAPILNNFAIFKLGKVSKDDGCERADRARLPKISC